MIEINLRTGRKITSHCCIVADSFRGPLLFTPSDRANRHFFAIAKAEATKFFGEYPQIFIPPRIRTDAEDRPWLPDVRVIALFGSDPLEMECATSTAVLIWYQSSPCPLIGADVKDDIEGIDWDAVAKDESLM